MGLERVKSSSAENGLDHWREVVCRELIGVEAIPDDAEEFDGRFTMTALGGAALARVEASAMAVYRSERYIADDPEPGYLINILISGRARTDQSGNSGELIAGDIFLQDTTLPYSLDLGTPAVLLTLRAPRSLVLRHLTPSERMHGMPFRRDGIARVVVSSLISLADVAPQISREEQEIALGAILSVLGAASADLSSQASTSAHRCFSRAARFIETNLGDPALTPGKIATACGISTRQLNRMFEAEHETVSRVVMRRRLERCRLDLLSPALTNRTVSEIAFSWGFNNLSHFSESFRRAYGQSPRSCRRPVGPTRQ